MANTIEELLGKLSSESPESEKTASAPDKTANHQEGKMAEKSLMDLLQSTFTEVAPEQKVASQPELSKEAADAAAHQFGVDVGYVFNAMLSDELEKFALEQGINGAPRVETNEVADAKGHPIDTHGKHVHDLKEKALAKKKIEKMLANPVANVPAGMTQGQPGGAK